jgi:hypothetical protein
VARRQTFGAVEPLAEDVGVARVALQVDGLVGHDLVERDLLAAPVGDVPDRVQRAGR